VIRLAHHFRLLGALALPLVAEAARRGAPTQAPAAPTPAAGSPLQIVLLLSALTLLPTIVMCLTPFLRLTLVLHFLRQALGTQTAPSNQVLIGLSLFLSLLVMQPVVSSVLSNAWEPLEQGKIGYREAADEASKAVKPFLMRFAREKEIRLFLEITRTAQPHSAGELDMKILVPAYILSELKAGFQIGAVIFLPFLIIDIVVASVTVSIGMVQLPPVMISAPFKILLFVVVDGWTLVVGGLLRSFLQ
jgi:flagellar biosynthetic protein FliP